VNRAENEGLPAAICAAGTCPSRFAGTDTGHRTHHNRTLAGSHPAWHWGLCSSHRHELSPDWDIDKWKADRRRSTWGVGWGRSVASDV